MPAYPEPIQALIDALTVWDSTTTADGAAGGTTLVDASLVAYPNDFITNQVTVLIMSGALWKEKQGATGFVPGTGTISFPAFTGQILAGTQYKLLNVPSGSIIALVLAALNTRAGALAYMGICPAGMAASLTNVRCPNLIGFGDETFASNYEMMVVRNANSARNPPEMEIRTITSYTSATGLFVCPAFSANVEENDIVIVGHSSVMSRISAFGWSDAGSGVGLIRDANRTEANNWWRGHSVMMLNGLAKGQIRPIVKFINATGDIIPFPDFDGAVGVNDTYVILSEPNPVIAAVSGQVLDGAPAVTDFDTDLVEATNNHYNGGLLMFVTGVCRGQFHFIDVYTGGTKNCTFAAGDQWTDIPANGDAFVVFPGAGIYLKSITAAATAAAAYAIINSGLSFRAVVTGLGGANQFSCGTLAGVGAGAFVDAVAPYRCFVFIKGDGTMTAPHGQTQDVTAYVTGTGMFTTNPFTAAVAVGDTVIVMHPRIAELAEILLNTKDIETKLDGAAVVTELFNTTSTVKANSVTLFQIDALGGTIRNIRLNFYLALDAAATFSVIVQKTRTGDLLTFTQDEELDDTIALPAANRVHSYALGDLPEGLQMRVIIAQDNAGNANNACDAALTYEG